MSIVKSLIEQMQGTIEVQSTLGVGTTFTYRLSFLVDKEKQQMDHCTQSGEYVLDVETTGLDIYNDILVGICLYTPGETSAYVPFNHTDLQNIRLEDQMSEEQVRDIMIPYLQDPELRCINHNIKFDNKKLAWDWKQIIVNIFCGIITSKTEEVIIPCSLIEIKIILRTL